MTDALTPENRATIKCALPNEGAFYSDQTWWTLSYSELNTLLTAARTEASASLKAQLETAVDGAQPLWSGEVAALKEDVERLKERADWEAGEHDKFKSEELRQRLRAESAEAQRDALLAAAKPFVSDELIRHVEQRHDEGICNFGRAACVAYPTTLGDLYDLRDVTKQARDACKDKE